MTVAVVNNKRVAFVLVGVGLAVVGLWLGLTPSEPYAPTPFVDPLVALGFGGALVVPQQGRFILALLLLGGSALAWWGHRNAADGSGS